jgi:sugar phosphate isomerase/epimerase
LRCDFCWRFDFIKSPAKIASQNMSLPHKHQGTDPGRTFVQLSIITDEISEDFPRALSVCRELQINTVELRVIEGKNIVFHDQASIQHIQALLQEGGLRVCAIASPFLKCTFDGDASDILTVAAPGLAPEWEILQRSFEIAHLLGAPFVRTFSFLRVADPTSVRPALLEIIGEAVRRTEQAGLKLIIENEHACNLATGAETGWLLQRIPSPSFGITWDPGNEAALGSPAFPDGYEHVRGRVLHMHVKDVNRHLEGAKRQEWFVKVGTGSIDYVEQFRLLKQDGYSGYLSLETHYNHPTGGREQATRESLAALRSILREAGVALTWEPV